MTPTAHASSELLAGYASGGLSEGMTLLVASHIALCPPCRSRVARFEAIGGALLRDGDAMAVSPGCLEGALARIQQKAEIDRPRSMVADSSLPPALVSRLGMGLGEIGWRFLLPGLSEYRLKGFEGEDVRLLRARPGVRILQHTHVGDEATLVLTGEMRDGERTLARGDLAFADQSDEHHPEIVGHETCICLVVLSGRMRFTGPVGRALNLFN